MDEVRIELQGISKSYYSETAVTQALRKINLTFHRSEFVAITGESGSGKSTLLNIIGGMDSFDEGEMFVDGNPTFQFDDEDWEEYRRTKIGYVFQDYSLIGHYTALDNIVGALLIMGISHEEAIVTAQDYLRQVGLDGYETHRVSELSSGQKQRLSIARALAKNTGIIVADEPTGNLDSETGEQIIRILSKLSTNRLVIMVTHNYEQAEPYVTRKIRIHDGQVISDVQNQPKQISPDSEIAYDDPSEPADAKEKKRQKRSRRKKPAKKKPGLSLLSLKKKLPFLKQNDSRSSNERRWENEVALFFATLNRKTQRGRAALFTTFLFIISVASFIFVGELFQHRDDYSTRHYTQSAFTREDMTRIIVKHPDNSEMTREDYDALSSISNVKDVDLCNLANDINFYLELNQDYKFIYGDSSRRRGNAGSDGEVKTISFLNENRFMNSSDCLKESDLSAGRLPVSQSEIVLYSTDESVLDTKKPCYFMAKNIWDSGQYCQIEMKIVGILKKQTSEVYFSENLCRMLSSHLDSDVFRLAFNYDESYGDYRSKRMMVPIVNEQLNGMDARITKAGENEGIPYGMPCPFIIEYYDEGGNLQGQSAEDMINILPDRVENGTSDFIEVSQDFFDQFYKESSIQASVYVTNYAKLDSVLRKLRRKGYDAISSYRISVNDYNQELVTQRLTIIGISAFGLFMLLLAEVLILRSLMKIRIKDYFILKFIGMKLQVIRKISYMEMGVYTLTAMIFTLVLMWILRLARIPVIYSMMWYYNAGAYLAFALYNILLILLTVAFFNRLLKGRLNA